MKGGIRTPGVLGVVLLALAAGARAQESGARPEFLPDGEVGVPAFVLPPSEFMSPEAVEVLKERARRPVTGSSFGSSVEESRAGVERALAPQVAAARERYAVEISPAQIAGVKTQVIVPDAGEADSSRVLVNLHGGAFSMCAHGCAMLESIPIAAVGRLKVVTVDYRQGPEHLFPAATEDVVAVYQDLLKKYQPEKIGIYGCSAGGLLTAQVQAWLLDKGLPSPGALGIFGAGATRFGTGDSAYVAGYIDGSFAPPSADGKPAMTIAYFRDADVKSPLVSPAGRLDVLAKFPPTLFVTGTRAMDLSPAIYSHNRLLKAGARSELIVGEAMGHCYLYNTEVPEARDAYDAIVRFFDENL